MPLKVRNAEYFYVRIQDSSEKAYELLGAGVNIYASSGVMILNRAWAWRPHRPCLHRPNSATSTRLPSGFRPSMRAFFPSTFTITKFSVLKTLTVMPSGGVSTS